MPEATVNPPEIDRYQKENARLRAIIASYEEDLARAYSAVLAHFSSIGIVYNEAVEKAKNIFKK